MVDAVRTYLTIGGERNLGECMKFLADRLLLTGYGSAPPLAMPEHGVYLPDVENATIADWEQRRDPSKPTAAILFYRAHALSGNIAFIDELIDALEQRGLNALAVFTSSLRAQRRRRRASRSAASSAAVPMWSSRRCRLRWATAASGQ